MARRTLDVSKFQTKSTTELKRLQQKEAIKRYQFINGVLKEGQVIDRTKAKDLRIKLDRVLTHKVGGYFIFFAILLLIFQAIYDWATVPMDLIDTTFASLAEWIKKTLPSGGMLTDLLAEGIVSGIGGVVIFIPQIAFLFLFISIFWTMLCIVVIFRKQWIDQERLVFPVARFGIELIGNDYSLNEGLSSSSLTNRRSFFSNPYMWVGFSLAFLYNFMNIICLLYTSPSPRDRG